MQIGAKLLLAIWKLRSRLIFDIYMQLSDILINFFELLFQALSL